MNMRKDYERLVKAGRAYQEALRSGDSLYEENTVPARLTELKAAAMGLGPPDAAETTKTDTDQR